jgi:hypothetical protein
MRTPLLALLSLAIVPLLIGSPDHVEAQTPAVQLINPPKSSARKAITQLAYIDAYDEVLGDNYAFVAYKEEETKNGEWSLKIKGKKVADTVIDPQSPTPN